MNKNIKLLLFSLILIVSTQTTHTMWRHALRMTAPACAIAIQKQESFKLAYSTTLVTLVQKISEIHAELDANPQPLLLDENLFGVAWQEAGEEEDDEIHLDQGFLDIVQECAEVTVHVISRQEALTGIKDCTSRLFYEADERHLSEHINDIAALAQHLDPEEDLDILEVVAILEENKNYTGICSVPFWAHQFSDPELNETLPLNEEIKAMYTSEIISKLTKRLRR